MIIRVTNIGGFLSLIYIWYNSTYWLLSVNQNNIVSSTFVKILDYLPTSLLFCIIFLLYLRAIIKNTGVIVYAMYFSSLIILELLAKISLHTLMLEGTTSFFLFNVTHNVPLELNYIMFKTY